MFYTTFKLSLVQRLESPFFTNYLDPKEFSKTYFSFQGPSLEPVSGEDILIDSFGCFCSRGNVAVPKNNILKLHLGVQSGPPESVAHFYFEYFKMDVLKSDASDSLSYIDKR